MADEAPELEAPTSGRDAVQALIMAPPEHAARPAGPALSEVTGIPMGRKPGIPGTVSPEGAQDRIVPYTTEQRVHPWEGVMAHTANIHNPIARVGARIGALAGMAASGFEPEKHAELRERQIESEHSQELMGQKMDLMQKVSEERIKALEDRIAATERGQDIGLTKERETTAGAATREGMKEKSAAELQAEKLKATADTERQKHQEFLTGQDFKKWKANLDNETKLRVAEMTANRAPAAMLQSATFGIGAQNQISKAQAALNRLHERGILGTIPQDKLENWLFDKGLVDPTLDPSDVKDIALLRSALEYTSSAAMRAHTGRTSNEIYQDFKKMHGLGQNYDALQSTLENTNDLMQDYINAASNISIESVRGGTAGAKPKTPPAEGLPSIDEYLKQKKQ